MGQFRIVTGSTVPGDGWQDYEGDVAKVHGQAGSYIDVDTSSAGFKSEPIYLVSIRGEAYIEHLTGVNAVLPRRDNAGNPLPMAPGFAFTPSIHATRWLRSQRAAVPNSYQYLADGRNIMLLELNTCGSSRGLQLNTSNQYA